MHEDLAHVMLYPYSFYFVPISLPFISCLDPLVLLQKKPCSGRRGQHFEQQQQQH